MQAINTLSDLVESAGAKLRVFDLGRRLCKLSSQQFRDFENAATAYPYPFQRQAWLGLLVWNPKQLDEHVIWFLKLPLDEQGLLIQAARDDLLARLLQKVGERLLEQDADQDPLKDNPFAFTPDQERMAAFHARATQILRQPPSRFYADCQAYLHGSQPGLSWEDLGWQGIADLVARLEEGENAQALRKQLPELPGAPLEAFCVNLETIRLEHAMSEALALRLDQELETDTTANRIGALLRGLAQAQPASLRNQSIEKVLASDWGGDLEVLAAIAGRCWEALSDPDLCMQYLEKLAQSPAGPAAFNALIADLLYLPGMRPSIMTCLRNPQRSDALSQAIGKLFGAVG